MLVRSQQINCIHRRMVCGCGNDDCRHFRVSVLCSGVEEEFPCPKLSWHQVMSMLDPLKLAMKSLGQRLKHQEMELLKVVKFANFTVFS